MKTPRMTIVGGSLSSDAVLINVVDTAFKVLDTYFSNNAPMQTGGSMPSDHVNVLMTPAGWNQMATWFSNTLTDHVGQHGQITGGGKRFTKSTCTSKRAKNVTCGGACDGCSIPSAIANSFTNDFNALAANFSSDMPPLHLPSGVVTYNNISRYQEHSPSLFAPEILVQPLDYAAVPFIM